MPIQFGTRRRCVPETQIQRQSGMKFPLILAVESKNPITHIADGVRLRILLIRHLPGYGRGASLEEIRKAGECPVAACPIRSPGVLAMPDSRSAGLKSVRTGSPNNFLGESEFVLHHIKRQLRVAAEIG